MTDETSKYRNVVWDPKSECFLIEDVEYGDYVPAAVYRDRRIWRHICPNGTVTNWTETVRHCLYCGHVRPESPKKQKESTPVSEKFEYRWLETGWRRATNSTIDRLNQLGKEGWEAVGIMSEGGVGTTFLLKRVRKE